MAESPIDSHDAPVEAAEEEQLRESGRGTAASSSTLCTFGLLCQYTCGILVQSCVGSSFDTVLGLHCLLTLVGDVE